MTTILVRLRADPTRVRICVRRQGDVWCNVAARATEQITHEKERLKEAHRKELEALRASIPTTPDAARFEIIDFMRIGPHLVLKVQYPNCAKCSYEGNKVLVFLNVSEADVIRWRVIDPHFRDPKAPRQPREAPSPAARFPASADGWSDARAYAQGKVKSI